jgi:hypothetical protein
VYRRRGYQYGIIRLVEEHAPGWAAGAYDQALAVGLQRAADG